MQVTLPAKAANYFMSRITEDSVSQPPTVRMNGDVALIEIKLRFSETDWSKTKREMDYLLRILKSIAVPAIITTPFKSASIYFPWTTSIYPQAPGQGQPEDFLLQFCENTIEDWHHHQADIRKTEGRFGGETAKTCAYQLMKLLSVTPESSQHILESTVEAQFQSAYLALDNGDPIPLSNKLSQLTPPQQKAEFERFMLLLDLGMPSQNVMSLGSSIFIPALLSFSNTDEVISTFKSMLPKNIRIVLPHFLANTIDNAVLMGSDELKEHMAQFAWRNENFLMPEEYSKHFISQAGWDLASRVFIKMETLPEFHLALSVGRIYPGHKRLINAERLKEAAKKSLKDTAFEMPSPTGRSL